MEFDNLNDDQKSAILYIGQKIDSGVKSVSLVGAAGTGKTTTVRHVISRLKGYKILLLAPTHSARGVLEELSGDETSTIHKALGLAPNTNIEDYDPDKPEFQPLYPPITTDYDIVLVEEASMVNTDLLHLLETTCKQLIFVGDECQLPPVGESYSPALQSECKYTLTKVMRQKNASTLKSLLSLMRIIISVNSDPPLPYEDNSIELLQELGLDFMPNTCYDAVQAMENHPSNDNTVDFSADLEELILGWEEEESNEYVCLAFRNKIVDALNLDIGKVIFEPKLAERYRMFCEGYRVLFTESHVAGKLEGITNNTKARVKSVGKEVSSYKLGRASIDCIEMEFELANGTIYKCYRPKSENDFINYLQLYSQVHEACGKSKKWDALNQLKGDVQIFRETKDQDSTDWLISKHTFVDTRKRPKWSIKPGYAMTVHKSQGTTYKYIIAHLEDIRNSRELSDRLLYVALSRASEKVFII
jgi:hypothetical protein